MKLLRPEIKNPDLRHFSNIALFEFFDTLRSRWFFLYFILTFVFTFFILYMSSGTRDEIVVSMLNFMLLMVPLFTMLFGVLSFHESLPFQKVILSYGVKRKSIFAGKFCGMITGLTTSYTIALAISMLITGSLFSNFSSLFLLFVYGLLMHFVFLSLAFLLVQFPLRLEIVTGTSLLIWFLLYVLYDSLILALVILFGDYPLDWVILGMVLANPIDTIRTVIMMQISLSSLMGLSSALYANMLGGTTGIIVGTGFLMLWSATAFLAGYWKYKRKDL